MIEKIDSEFTVTCGRCDYKKEHLSDGPKAFYLESVHYREHANRAPKPQTFSVKPHVATLVDAVV